MAALNLMRLVLFILIALFSLVVLGILCNFTSITTAAGFYYQSFALGIATSLMSIIIIAASLIVERFRRGAVTSLVWFELAWVGLLWVLWLATAAAISSLNLFSSCGFYNSQVESNCRQYQAVQAFAWLNWLMMFGWFCILLIVSILSASRGTSSVWKTSVTEHPFNEKQAGPYGAATYPSYSGSTYKSSYGGSSVGHTGAYPQQQPAMPPYPQA